MIHSGIVAGVLALGLGQAPRALAQQTSAEEDDGQCPSSVPGARTTLKDTDDGVVITVVGKDGKAAKEIQRRAREIASVRQLPAAGPNQPRECVVAFYQGSEASMETLPRGVKVTVKALDADNVGELQEKTRARAQPAATPPAGVPPTLPNPAQ
jgi:hypothetical protein